MRESETTPAPLSFISMRKSITSIILLTLPLFSLSQTVIKDDVQETIALNYSISGKYEEAIEIWKTLPLKEMQLRSIEEYAIANYFLGRHTDGLSIARQGLSIHPKSASLNRSAMVCSVELGQNDDAQAYGHALFSRPDTVKYYDVDYYYYGRSYDELRQYREAIIEFEKALTMPDSVCLMKRDIIEKDLMQSYAGLGAWNLEQAEDLKGEQQKTAYREADNSYAALISRFPEAMEYGTFMRARCSTYLDPDARQGLAVPFYLKLIDVLSTRQPKSELDMGRLTEAYKYMISYYANVKSDLDTAKEYGMKLYELDPEDPIAKQVLNM